MFNFRLQIRATLSRPFAGVKPEYRGYWAPRKGIYDLDTTTKPAIAFFDFAGDGVTHLSELETRPAREVTGEAESPDGRTTILYTRLDALTRDIIVLDNLQ